MAVHFRVFLEGLPGLGRALQLAFEISRGAGQDVKGLFAHAYHETKGDPAESILEGAGDALGRAGRCFFSLLGLLPDLFYVLFAVLGGLG